MPILNEENTTCQNASSGCRATDKCPEHPGTGRCSNIVYNFVEEGSSNLYIDGRENEGPIQLIQFHRNCHQCPYNVLKIVQD
jgi:hypothetical protein